MNNRFKLIADLYCQFFKIGSFNFGGGYAMLTKIEDVCVNKKNWISKEDMMDITVISQSTPGPIFVKSATYIGYKQAGIAGAVAASGGMLTTSFLLVFLISTVFENLLTLPLVRNIFRGIQASVGYLVLSAGLSLRKQMPDKSQPLAIMYSSMLAMLAINILGLKISAAAVMLVCGCIPLSMSLIRKGAK